MSDLMKLVDEAESTVADVYASVGKNSEVDAAFTALRAAISRGQQEPVCIRMDGCDYLSQCGVVCNKCGSIHCNAPPPTVSRDAVLEEAARVCDQRETYWENDMRSSHAAGARNCAHLIRALKGEPAVSQWQDISTAPDGELVLMYGKNPHIQGEPAIMAVCKVSKLSWCGGCGN